MREERTDFGGRKARNFEKIKELDPRNYDLLRRFVTEHGKIIPARLTGVSAKQQRQLKTYIGRARVMGLLP